MRRAEEPATAALLAALFGNSPFLTRLAFAHPDIVRLFVTRGPEAALAATPIPDGFSSDASTAMSELRQAKARAALAIALADIDRRWDLQKTTASLSDFADGCLRYALATLLRGAHESGRLHLSDPANPMEGCGFVVLALGKLGGRELNYSSDIDLFVLFDPARLPYTGRKSPQEFAVELAKDVVRVLQERTGDGYVFRADLRLRPDSTALAVSRAAAQSYYESFGQNWERAALIKARFVAGDAVTANGFLRDLQPFIWRKSLDFYTLQDIHSIKRQIYAHKGGAVVQVAGHNIKLGRGGIREIEFFVQTQQLIWGGRLPETRIPATLPALDAVTKLGFVAPNVRDDMATAYRYLRELEHRLQMIADEQTQTLPADSAELGHLATFMGYPDRESFEAHVSAMLTTVERHYAGLFEDAPALTVGGNLVFTGAEDDPDTMDTLRRLGFANPSGVAAIVRAWHHGRYRATRSDRARQILTEIMPNLLAAFGKTAQPDAALVRFDRCLGELPGGVQLLAVFQANPLLLDLVAEIMGDAPRLAEHVTRNPGLLDYVLEPEFYAPLEDRPALVDDLQSTLAAAEAFETALDLCRGWVNDQRFRIGVQCLSGHIPPEGAARHLSDIAEAVLSALVPLVAAEFAEQFGKVGGGGLALVAYGKLGSRDLTPTSDLDLVVVYDGPLDGHSEGGPRRLPVPAYYIRLTQRLVTALTVTTRAGNLYAIDLRLRPDGDQGPLACSVMAFSKYQQESAWTWEHLALTRARVVFGPSDLARRIERIIADALARPRDRRALVAAVADMRQRMRKEHDRDRGPWEVKHRPGGLIDVEFIIQYLLLATGRGGVGPGWDDAIAGLVATGALPDPAGRALAEGHRLWSRLQGILRLTVGDGIAAEDLPEGLKGKLAAAVGVQHFAALEGRMSHTSSAISALFHDMIELPAQGVEHTAART